jgi:DNA-binding SARP family transcriptional activator
MIRLEVLGGLALRGPDGADLRAVLAQPKRFALLAYLALQRPGTFTRRDTLLALFWPELPTERARQALRQSLYYLRRQLGPDAFRTRGSEEVAVNPAGLWCDAAAFRAAAEAGRVSEALGAYRGDLLPGFFVTEAAPELDRWLEHERAELRLAAAGGAWRLAETAEAASDAIGAAQWARRAADLATGDEVAARRLIAMLVRLGDHEGALHAYVTLRARLAAEFGAEPAPDTRALVAPLRRVAGTPPEPLGAGSAGREDGVDASYAPVWGGRAPRRRAAAFAAVGAVVILGVAAALAPAVRGAAAGPPVVAVGWIQGHGPGGDSAQAGALPDLLTTALSRVPRLQMLTRGRLYDVKAQLGLGALDGPSLRDVARQAGATELVEGELYRTADNQLRLDLRRLALSSGRVLQAASESGAELLEVVDRATATLAGGLGYAPPQWRFATAGDAVVIARRFFDEGLRAFYQSDYAGARGLLQAALRSDSTLAMAAYYLVLSEEALEGQAARVSAWWAHATRMADSAPDQERLFIKSTWANATMDPAGLAFAETLVVRYPSLPDAHLQMGYALALAGEPTAAVPWFRRALEMDSPGLGRERSRCVGCDAQSSLVGTYWDLDSLAAAERVARHWVERAPVQASAWYALATSLERQGRFAEAMRAIRDAGGAFTPAQARVLEQTIAIRAGDFDDADRALREIMAGAEPKWRVEAQWWLTVSLRMQGRYREALAAGAEYQRLADSVYGGRSAANGVARAVALLDVGRGREAAVAFDAIARAPAGATPTATARNRTWFLTHTASALYAAGQGQVLNALANRIEASGRESGYGRDRLLHHYVRGLARSSVGAFSDAVMEYRRNRLSFMYGLAGYHEAEAELALGRPLEAVRLLRRVLRGSLETGNLYVNFTSVRDLLGDAYSAAGRPDSAAAQFRWVTAAWRRADPGLAARAAEVRAKLALATRPTEALVGAR